MTGTRVGRVAVDVFWSLVGAAGLYVVLVALSLFGAL